MKNELYLRHNLNDLKVALQVLIDNIDEKNFQICTEKISKIKGQIIISGIGKTGWIGQSFAAGMKSIGIKASFIQASEASHGDLGTLSTSDLVIILSKSGQSAELYPLIDYCNANKICLMAITMNTNSYLLQYSSEFLLLPKVLELPPVDILPSTSNFLFNAICELIKVEIAQIHNFTNSQFVATHPGGRIGSKNITIDRIMRSGNSMPLVKAHTLMVDVLLEMTKKLCGCAVVVDSSNKMLGIITDGDLRRQMQNKNITFESEKAEEIMIKNPFSVNKNMTVEEAEVMMVEKGVSQLLVAEHNEIIGIVHFMDLVNQHVYQYDITSIPQSKR